MKTRHPRTILPGETYKSDLPGYPRYHTYYSGAARDAKEFGFGYNNSKQDINEIVSITCAEFRRRWWYRRYISNLAWQYVMHGRPE